MTMSPAGSSETPRRTASWLTAGSSANTAMTASVRCVGEVICRCCMVGSPSHACPCCVSGLGLRLQVGCHRHDEAAEHERDDGGDQGGRRQCRDEPPCPL